MNHFSLSQIQEYADGILNEASSKELEIHLKTCNECSIKMAVLKNIEVAIRTVPLVYAQSNFTQRVMSKLSTEEVSDFAWGILKSLAPIISLAFLVGIIFVLFQYTGLLQNSEVQQTIHASKSIYSVSTSKITESVSMLNIWLQKYIPFVYQKTHYWMTTFIFLLFIIVALLDKYIIMPMIRKRSEIF